MIASALKKILNSHIQFLKRTSVEEQRAQKIRPILKRKTDCVHAFVQPELMNRYKDSQTYSLYVSRMMMSKISMSDGLRHYHRRMNHLRIRSWKDCRSQNSMILFSYRLYWLCVIQKRCETEDKQVIQD